jgi:hypothetical protein
MEFCEQFLETNVVMKFLRAKKYSSDFTTLTQQLDTILNQLHLTWTGQVREQVANVQEVCQVILSKFESEMGDLFTRLDHVDWLLTQQKEEQQACLEALQLQQNLQMDKMLTMLAELKQEKETNAAAYRRNAVKKFKSCLTDEAPPPLSANDLTIDPNQILGNNNNNTNNNNNNDNNNTLFYCI